MVKRTILIGGTVDGVSLAVLSSYTMPNSVGFPSPPFKVTRPQPGTYDVEFYREAFDAPGPVVTATIYGGALNLQDNAHVFDSKKNYIRIRTGDSNGNPSNRSFSFVAVGTYEVEISSLANSF